MKLPGHILLSENDLEWCRANNVCVTWPGREDYPELLYDLPCRPAYLFYIGSPVWRTWPLLSVVGSRTPQMVSLGWMDAVLSELLRRRPLAIVSGGARGVDQKAHQVALRQERPTVLFMPAGLRHPYPADLSAWVSPIVSAGGCVVSQFLPSMPMRKHCFRERNRLIASISKVTLIIECRRRSGTWLTARYASDLDRKIYVMPTFPGEAGMGGLDLICDSHAVPARDVEDIDLSFHHLPKLKDGEA
jgi:DNA processing protein